jgi:plasmid stability protein
MVRKPTELRPVMTRLPERLRARLEREAARNDRSMNAEIIHRLEQSFRKEDQNIFVVTSAENAANMMIDKLNLRDLARLADEMRTDRESKS